MEEDKSKLCIQCKLFYGLHCNNKCYRCANNLPKLFSQFDQQFREELNTYINTFLPPNDYLDTLKFACKTNKTNIIKILLDEIFKMDKYLTAKIVEPLLRDLGQDSISKARIILPYILDTWNITLKNNFKTIEECYFNKIQSIDFPNKIPLDKKYIPDRKLDLYKDVKVCWSGYKCL